MASHGPPNGLPIAVAGDFAALDQADALVLPAIRYQELSQLQRRLDSEPDRRADPALPCDWYPLVCANRTGGQLAGPQRPARRASGHHQLRLDRLVASTLTSDSLTTLCGSRADGVIGSGAASAHYNLTLRLIESFGGSDLAICCAQRALVDRPSQAPYADFQQLSATTTPADRPRSAVVAAADGTAFTKKQGGCAGHQRAHLMRRFARREIRCSTGRTGCRQLGACWSAALWKSKQIAAEVGYGDVSSFRRLFKRELSCAPGYYRRHGAPDEARQIGENGIQRQSAPADRARASRRTASNCPPCVRPTHGQSPTPGRCRWRPSGHPIKTPKSMACDIRRRCPSHHPGSATATPCFPVCSETRIWPPASPYLMLFSTRLLRIDANAWASMRTHRLSGPSYPSCI